VLEGTPYAELYENNLSTCSTVATADMTDLSALRLKRMIQNSSLA
jgi:hypothetical protein